MNSELQRRVIKARIALLMTNPFFGTVAMALDIVEDDTADATAWTDGLQLGFSPSFVEGLDDRALIGLIAHEVMHVSDQHHLRRGARDPDRWNEACDFAINGILLAENFTLPDGGLHNPKFDGMAAEVIYALLPPSAPKKRAGNGKPGHVRDGRRRGAVAERGNDAATTRAIVQRAAKAARSQGKLSQGVARFVGEATRVREDYLAVLAGFVTERASSDYAWAHPDRRFVSAGFVLPSLYSEEMGGLAFAIDSSGSMGSEDLAAACTVVNEIVARLSPSYVDVFVCDCVMRSVERFDKGQSIQLTSVPGGGGTDFRPVFDKIDEATDAPKCLVYFTDAIGTFPETPPAYPVLWVVTGPGTVPWGASTRVD